MKTFALVLLLLVSGCYGGYAQPSHYTSQGNTFALTPAGAAHLASLPMKCIQQHFPYKTGIVFTDSSLITAPQNYHPAFCGCFDWHSSVHGHWMLVRLAKLFPNLPGRDSMLLVLKQQLTNANIGKEIRLFSNKDNRSFERTYGWAWLLQLQKELLEWKEPVGQQLAANVQPLAALFSNFFIEYLAKLNYPIRVGEHTNLAFSLKLAWDYSIAAKDDSLRRAIQVTALRFYSRDEHCPLSWEPGGNDFLSPCLEEADLMWRILPQREYQTWIGKFLPVLFQKGVRLPVGEVADRSDGRLVHLDGLNFSRASCLYAIAAHIHKNKEAIMHLAHEHVAAALPHVATGEYMGEHWLGSFAVYALTVAGH